MTVVAANGWPGTGRGGATLRVLAGVLALALLLAAAAWWLRSTQWPISVVRIDGAMAHTDPAAVERVVTGHTDGAGFFRLELGALRADLEALPWLRTASLRRVWPDALQVVVYEHVAAARWNGAALVSERGTVFRPASLPGLELPELSGPEGHGAGMLQRLRALDRRLGPLGLAVRGLHQDARRAWRVELDNGVALRLGRGEIDRRLDRFVAVWPSVLERKAGHIDAVDLRYPNGFAVAWREGAGEQAREGGA